MGYSSDYAIGFQDCFWIWDTIQIMRLFQNLSKYRWFVKAIIGETFGLFGPCFRGFLLIRQGSIRGLELENRIMMESYGSVGTNRSPLGGEGAQGAEGSWVSPERDNRHFSSPET